MFPKIPFNQSVHRRKGTSNSIQISIHPPSELAVDSFSALPFSLPRLFFSGDSLHAVSLGRKIETQ